MFREPEAVNIPILITKKESYYIMPYTPWYKKPWRVFWVIILIFLTYIGSTLYAHWSDPSWCSPWLRKDICEAENIQDQLDNGIYPTPVRSKQETTDQMDEPATDQPVDQPIDQTTN